jgi:hypothetical protein
MPVGCTNNRKIFRKGLDMAKSIDISASILAECSLIAKNGVISVKYGLNGSSNISESHPTSDFVDFAEILEFIPVKNVVRDILGNPHAAKHFILAITLECCREYGVSNVVLLLSKILDIGGI